MWVALIVGLVGVLVGGFVTAGVEMFRDWRSDRATIRTATRLIRGELAGIDLELQLLLEHGVTPPRLPDASNFLPSVLWRDYRSTLARSRVLNDDSWDFLSAVYDNVEHIRAGLLADPPGSRIPGPLVHEIKMTLGQVRAQAEKLRGPRRRESLLWFKILVRLDRARKRVARRRETAGS